ncbi:hypothetical protein Nepgr_031390 [Nepenthes gracilis]|uniref:Uncharacterized protein n=1 Tax=Nepenthes gracilis TaxID=150966 RepID=A0AAD3Y4R6_NEPGR|nr:hypothetical protein Nepgr_031390 [Nepenthes gracilis]
MSIGLTLLHGDSPNGFPNGNLGKVREGNIEPQDHSLDKTNFWEVVVLLELKVGVDIETNGITYKKSSKEQ